MSAEIPEEQPQDWFFSFGIEHQVAGIPLGSRYVRYRGTWMGAREQMLANFGNAWSSQYQSESDIPRGLTELLLPLQEATR